MIRPLRRQHRWTFTLLALLLPALFLCALTARLDPPLMGSSPGVALRPEAVSGADTIATWRQPGVPAEADDALEIRLLRHRGAPRYQVQLVNGPRDVPDLLLYVSTAIAEGKPPTDAQLIGTARAAARGLVWPGEGPQTGQHLLLYSLAHDQIFAQLPVTMPEATP